MGEVTDAAAASNNRPKAKDTKMMTNQDREFHAQYDQAPQSDKDRIDRAYKAAASILREDGRMLCNCDGAEQLIAALWRHYDAARTEAEDEQILLENYMSKIS